MSTSYIFARSVVALNTQNGYNSLSDHLRDIYFTFRSIYQMHVLQQTCNMTYFCLNISIVIVPPEKAQSAFPWGYLWPLSFL